MDFYDLRLKPAPGGKTIKVYPDYKTVPSKDLMIRGGRIYAIWDERINAWNTNAYDAIDIIDNEIRKYVDSLQAKSQDPDIKYEGQYLRYSDTGQWKKFLEHVSNAPDNFIQLDSTLTFANSETKREDYSSKRLAYPLEPGDYSAWDELVGTLYEPEERQKIEWAIGSIVAGDAKDIQKFMVFYGAAGAGKSTMLNIIAQLFDGYWTTFIASDLTSKNNTFSTAPFKNNPLVAIQQDGDLSLISDNSKLNSLVSHEDIMIRDLYQSAYPARVNCFIFMGTNKPVKITDAKSGIIRRLIDVHPSNNLLPRDRYDELTKHRIKFELGAIAWHCLEVYKGMGPTYYDAYKPLDMMYQTDAFYNFVESKYDFFKAKNGVTMSQAWMMYKEYCDDALIDHRLVQYKFREELKNYFADYKDYARIDGKQLRKYYSGFLTSKFDGSEKVQTTSKKGWLKFDYGVSKFDILAKDYKAQLANEDEKPIAAWDYVTTTLSEIDTSKLHYVRVPENHIVIDFDIKDEHKAKSYEKNLEAANKFPPTYAELSKSEAGIHLHYIYDGDVSKLDSIYGDDIEVKIFRGKSSLRRKLTKCNSLDIAHINSGLPLKKETHQMIDEKSIKSESKLREQIKKALRKEINPGYTVTCVSYIEHILSEAYNSGLTYDVNDMYHDIYAFASSSHNSAKRCLRMVATMKFMSKDHERNVAQKDIRFADNAPITIFDIECYPNLFIICYKILGQPVIKMINPEPEEVYKWIWTEDGKLRYRLVGYNNKRYDNHMIAGRSTGDDLYSCFLRSQSIIDGSKNGFISYAYDISYTDIYDYTQIKQSLKKWEIDLGLPHKEMSIPWDQPVDPSMWDTVVDYCCNDVEATEAVWYATQDKFEAREILAEWAGMTCNTSTNDLTAQIIFGDDKAPQKYFNYRFMGDIPSDVLVLDTNTFEYHEEHGVTAEKLIKEGKFNVFDMQHRPVFPGYTFDQYAPTEKSWYRGECPSEGGYVYFERGEHNNVALLDITSMHPHSMKAENLFGDERTDRYYSIVDARVHIKHGEYKIVIDTLGDWVAKYLSDPAKAKRLSTILKVPINAVYGLTSAKFPNRFKDPRNVDNIVAKRGALFMINLKHEVQARGYTISNVDQNYTVAHIKTDSIKIPDADQNIIDFVIRYGKEYGYSFELEDVYDRMCLVNKSTYIAKYKEPHIEDGKEVWWTATAAQFQHPYVFKKLFSKEPIEFDDMCETKTVTQGTMYLDMNEKLPQLSTEESAELDILLKFLSENDQEKLEKKRATINKRYGYSDDGAIEKRYEELCDKESKSHNYVFIGRAGKFCPIKPGCGGGVLYREKDGKYFAVTGTTGYRWLESEMVQNLNKQRDIDLSYFQSLTDAAQNDISELCDFTWFVSDDKPKPQPKVTEDLIDIASDDLPF